MCFVYCILTQRLVQVLCILYSYVDYDLMMIGLGCINDNQATKVFFHLSIVKLEFHT